MPGLTSNNNSTYIINICIDAKKNGYQAVVINWRGGSDMPLTVRFETLIYFKL
jgi:predicted alpha/beta-fold hydrolase